VAGLRERRKEIALFIKVKNLLRIWANIRQDCAAGSG